MRIFRVVQVSRQEFENQDASVKRDKAMKSDKIKATAHGFGIASPVILSWCFCWLSGESFSLKNMHTADFWHVPRPSFGFLAWQVICIHASRKVQSMDNLMECSRSPLPHACFIMYSIYRRSLCTLRYINFHYRTRVSTALCPIRCAMVCLFSSKPRCQLSWLANNRRVVPYNKSNLGSQTEMPLALEWSPWMQFVGNLVGFVETRGSQRSSEFVIDICRSVLYLLSDGKKKIWRTFFRLTWNYGSSQPVLLRTLVSET